MCIPDDEFQTTDPALPARVRVARERGAYTIDVVAGLARVDPAVVSALETGRTIADVAARDRVLAVLGLRRDGFRKPVLALDLARLRDDTV